MEPVEQSLSEYINAKRILACIANANDEVDDNERHIIVRGIGQASGLESHQIQVMHDDLTDKPNPQELAASIRIPIIIKQLLADMSAFCMLKESWTNTEWEALEVAVQGVQTTPENKRVFIDALIAMRKIANAL